MTHRLPIWDLKHDVDPNHHMFKFDYEVAELTWENGQLALRELGRRVPSQTTSSWDQTCAAETLEALVNQATLQPYCKTDVAVNEDELVPRIHHHNPTIAVGKLNESVAGTSDALVPNSNNRTVEGSSHDQASIKSGRDAVVSSCSGNPSAFMVPRVQQEDRDLGGRRLMSTSTGSPENTSSGRDCSNTTFPDNTVCHHRTQKRETKAVNEKAKSSILNTRKRSADIHNQSERKRRDKINQKFKTLQKLIPNSSKTDKASMLDEVIEHIKQLQANVHTMSTMNMSPMMMSFIMQQQQQQQQQLQLHKSMMNSMGMGMGMGMGMDMNAIGPCNIPARFNPSPFMQMPCWNNRPADQVNTNATAGGPMPVFLASQSPALNMAALYYQQMQNQLCGQFSKN